MGSIEYSIKKPKVKNNWFTVRVDDDEMALLEKVAVKLKINRTDFVNHAVKKELAEAASKLFK